MESKFRTFVNVLDKIIESAPSEKYKKRYAVDTKELLNQSRSKAYLHLFLMANFGLLDFEEREVFVTDGSQDAGIDAYYFDEENKVKYYIQAKFRVNEENFGSKNIEISELTSMDISRVEAGELEDTSGNPYNGKIRGLQDKLQSLRNPGEYKTKVILLANSSLDQLTLRKLTGGYDVIVYDNKRIFSELLFPVVSGNYFNKDELAVSINLTNAEHPRITYKVNLGEQACNITVLFAPTYEIAKILHKYKNSVLRFNPRSYLDLKGNKVNKAIMATLVNSQNNEFALFNNGLTIVAEGCDFAERTGVKNIAKLTLKSPQIINGGQTAYTLSQAYEKYLDDKDKLKSVFQGKEVLVKIISFAGDSFDMFEDDSLDEIKTDAFMPEQMSIIERVSQATNRQSPIDDADGKANDEIQVKFQQFAFDNFGLYYERKRGEFVDGLSKTYISNDMLIKREDLVRCCLASDSHPGEARRANKTHLFKDIVIDKYLEISSEYESYLNAYIILNKLKNLEKSEKTSDDKYNVRKYGSALRYGKYAVISATIITMKMGFQLSDSLEKALSHWIDFENWVKSQEKNNSFFVNDENMLNYYKSNAINDDVISYFSKYR